MPQPFLLYSDRRPSLDFIGAVFNEFRFELQEESEQKRRKDRKVIFNYYVYIQVTFKR